MAIDTRDKRLNCLNVARAYTVAAPNPDGAISAQADRQQIACAYRGILAGSVATDLIWTVSFDSASQETVGNLSVTCTSADLVVSVL